MTTSGPRPLVIVAQLAHQIMGQAKLSRHSARPSSRTRFETPAGLAHEDDPGLALGGRQREETAERPMTITATVMPGLHASPARRREARRQWLAKAARRAAGSRQAHDIGGAEPGRQGDESP